METLQGFSAQGPSATSASQRVVTRINSEKSSHIFKTTTYINSGVITHQFRIHISQKAPLHHSSMRYL